MFITDEEIHAEAVKKYVMENCQDMAMIKNVLKKAWLKVVEEFSNTEW